MKREVGLWIDHRKAVIVTLVHPEDGMRRIQANVEKYVCYSETSSWNSPAVIPGTKKIENYLSSYYGDVLTNILEAESIQIFGPDEAKHDLERRLQREQLDQHIVRVESVEKMTDRQIEAKVWQHYLSV